MSINIWGWFRRKLLSSPSAFLHAHPAAHPEASSGRDFLFWEGARAVREGLTRAAMPAADFRERTERDRQTRGGCCPCRGGHCSAFCFTETVGNLFTDPVALFSTLCVLSILPSVARVFLHACMCVGVLSCFMCRSEDIRHACRARPFPPLLSSPGVSYRLGCVPTP